MKPPCVILAGGRSSRMGGGDKCLLPLDGRPVLAHVLERISPQVSSILINSNSMPDLFAAFGRPVLADIMPGYQGPLAGLLTGMTWAGLTQPDATHILSVSCDTPFLPHDLAQRLAEGLEPGDIAIARDRTGGHPVIGLWPVALADRLANDMKNGDIRGVYQWLRQFRARETAFDAGCFCNLNTRDELQQAESLFLISSNAGHGPRLNVPL
jgi:molybdopterin-guanine dinucleotide biosynthesis protein A